MIVCHSINTFAISYKILTFQFNTNVLKFRLESAAHSDSRIYFRLFFYGIKLGKVIKNDSNLSRS